MNQSKAFLVSLSFAFGAMMLVYLYVSDQKRKVQDEYGTEVEVVIAARDINEFEEIQPKSMLTVINVPQKFAQPSSRKLPEDFNGTVANAPIKKGEQILATKVLGKGSETGLASQVAISHRALSINVTDQTGVTKLIRPGDRIDVISNISYQVGDKTESEIKTLLQNVHVLAVGEMVQNQIPSALAVDPVTGETRATNIRGKGFNTVTVEVSPTEAQALIFVIGQGAEIFMTLRNPVDRQVASVPTTTVDDVLGPDSKKARGAIRLPAAAPPAPKPAPPAAPAFVPFLKQGGGGLAN